MKIRREKTETYTEEVPNTLKRFKSWQFTTGPTTGKDFDQFAKIYKKFVKNNLPQGAELVEYNKGHYELHGFIKKESNFVYFSISDVRYFKNEWADDILVRTVRGPNDFTGGANNSTDLYDFQSDVAKLLS